MDWCDVGSNNKPQRKPTDLDRFYMVGESKDGEKSNASKYTAEAMLKLFLDMED
jgi:hypothetical protein